MWSAAICSPKQEGGGPNPFDRRDCCGCSFPTWHAWQYGFLGMWSMRCSNDVASSARLRNSREYSSPVSAKPISGVPVRSSSSLKGNDGAAVEKRIRKTAEFGLGQTFQENGRAYASHERPGVNAMSQFLVQGGLLLNDLASNQVLYCFYTPSQSQFFT